MRTIADVLCLVAIVLLVHCEKVFGMKVMLDVTGRRDNLSQQTNSNTRFNTYESCSTVVTSYLDGNVERSVSTSKNTGCKKNSAPVVDSALLRFLASTRDGHRLNTETKNDALDLAKRRFGLGIPGSSSNYLDSISIFDDDMESTKVDISASTLKYARNNVVSTGMLIPAKEKERNERALWLRQFDASCVISLLLEKGAEENASKVAGVAVQQYAFERARNVVIRRFLHKRDVLWSKTSDSFTSNVEVDGLSATLSADQRSIDRRTNICIKALGSNEKYALTWCIVSNSIDELLDAGLSGNDCAAVLAHTPSLAMKGRSQETTKWNGECVRGGESFLSENVDRVLNRMLCGTLGLRKYDARKVIRRCPGLLTAKGTSAAEQVISLLSSLGLSSSALARDKPSLPTLLSRSPAALFRFVVFLTSDCVRMPVDRVGPLLRRSEFANVLDVVAPVSRCASGLATDSTSVDCIDRDKSSVFDVVNDTYLKMKLAAEALLDIVSRPDRAKVVSAHPSILLLHPSNQRSIVAFLEDMGMSRDDVSRIVQTFPSILGADPKQMQDAVGYLSTLEITPSAMAKIFRSFPSLLTVDVPTKMEPAVDFLKSIGVENVGRFVRRLPPILGYSVEDELIPKWKYLCKVCDFAYFEVVRFPAYFSYPLDKVIMSRFDYLRARGIPLKVVSVDDVLHFGDVDFSTKVVGDKDGGALYARFVNARRKRLEQRRKQSIIS